MYQEQEIEKLAREKSAIRREREQDRKELEKLREEKRAQERKIESLQGDVRQKDNGESAIGDSYILAYLQTKKVFDS